MSWIATIMQAVGTVVEQWMGASAEQRAEIEARALKAVSGMLAEEESTKSDHDALTAETQAEIDRAKLGA